MPSLFSVAQAYQQTRYDAGYFDLAKRRGIALATLDTAMRRGAIELGIVLLQIRIRIYAARERMKVNFSFQRRKGFSKAS